MPAPARCEAVPGWAVCATMTGMSAGRRGRRRATRWLVGASAVLLGACGTTQVAHRTVTTDAPSTSAATPVGTGTPTSTSGTPTSATTGGSTTAAPPTTEQPVDAGTLTAHVVAGVTVDLPAGWVDVTPAAWHAGGDHVDTLYDAPGDPASQVIVVSQFCVECAIEALGHPGQLAVGTLHPVVLGPRLVGFGLDTTAGSVSAFAEQQTPVPAGYASHGVELLSPSLTAEGGPSPVSAEVVVTLPVADTPTATAVLNSVHLR